MKKFFLKFFIIFILLFSIEVNASEKNPYYLEYQKLSDEEKANIDYVPNEYIVYYDLDKNNSTAKRSLFAFYSAIPSKFDLRNVDGSRMIPPIDNQGSLGLCWAFASNNILESYYLMHDKGVIDLSDDQASYVAKYLGDASFGAGNSPYNLLRYWLMGLSPISEDDFGKYSLTEKNVGYKDYLDNNNVLFDIKDVKVFPALNIPYVLQTYTLTNAVNRVSEYNTDIKNHIMTHGAVYAGIYWDFFDENKNLVYNDGTRSFDSYSDSGHAVTIIGWDDNYEGVSIKGTPVKGAWLAMNSWGSSYEYFYISYYDVTVVQCLLGVTSLDEKEWNNVYTGYELIDESNSKQVYKFKKGTNQEKIESVKILYSSNPTTAKVSISDGFNTYTSTSSTDLSFGIKTYEFGNVNFDSEELYVIIESAYDSSNFEISLYTSDVVENKVLEFEELEFNSFLGNVNFYNLYSKNIDTGSSVTINVFDDKNNDISSSFTFVKPVVINDHAYLELKSKSSLSSYEYIKIKATIGQVSDEIINYINGSGTSDSPYVIRTPQEMQFLSYNDVYLKLGNDIDLTEEIKSKYGLFYNSGYGWDPIDFNGVLDGDGYKIKNLTSKLGGLFLSMDDALLKNVKLENFNLNDVIEYSSASLVAVELKNNSIISNVYIDNANVTSNSIPVGGIVGFLYDGEISDVHIKDSSFNGQSGVGLVAFNIFNPENSTLIRNVFSNNSNISGNNKGLVSSYLSISGKTSNLKQIDIKYNVFNYDENMDLFGIENINITDNKSYDIYSNNLNLENNLIKKDNEIYDSNVFNNYNVFTWSFDINNSAYLQLFKDEFVLVDDSLLKLNNYELQSNMIYKVGSKTSSDDFIKDISNLNELSYKLYSSKGVELTSSDYVVTGSYLDINKDGNNQRFYIIVTGDVDGNGSSGAMDAYAIVLHTIAKKEISGKYLLAADYNFDGSVGARDAYAIILESIK